MRAIREVHAGGSFLYPPIAATLIGDYLRVTGNERPRRAGRAAERDASARSSS